jgi:hypothetical protein
MWSWGQLHKTYRSDVVGELLRTGLYAKTPLRSTIAGDDPFLLAMPPAQRRPWNVFHDELHPQKALLRELVVSTGTMKRRAVVARYFEQPHQFYVLLVPDMEPLSGPITREEAEEKVREINAPNVAQKVKRKEV